MCIYRAHPNQRTTPVLTYLSVENLAVVKKLSLDLHKGFNVLTGETGAGKSVLIEALGLILGARARTEVIRNQADEAVVEAVFDLREERDIGQRLEATGLDTAGGELIIKRTIAVNGRNRLFINGSPSTITTLREITDGLVEISGQHEYYSLLKEHAGLDILDAWAELGDQASRFKALYHRWRDGANRLQELRHKSSDMTGRADYLRFQIDEIAACKLTPGEEEELKLHRDRLRNRDKLLSTLQSVQQRLYSGNHAAISVLSQCAAELARLGHMDLSLDRAATELETARVTAEEAVFSLARLTNSMEDDSQSLEEIEERLDVIHSLCRKHGPSVEDVLRRQREMAEELSCLENIDSLVREAEEDVKKLATTVSKAAAALSESRRRAALPLSEQITDEMNSLMMAGAAFRVKIEQTGRSSSSSGGIGGGSDDSGHSDEGGGNGGSGDSSASGVIVISIDNKGRGAGETDHDTLLGIGPDGADRVSLLFRPSRDGEFSPLSRTASGGELSRIMLAVKKVLMAKDQCETYVFDEIDAGIGGVAADTVGDRLRQVADSRQVICVTHLPQIAAQADFHLVITKGEVEGRTESSVRPVAGLERVREIARMLSGRDMTSTALAHAEEMMARRIATK